MTGIITIATIGTSTGPFNIYSNVDGYLSAFATNITRAQLLAGYVATNIPDGTTVIRVHAIGQDCDIFIEIILDTVLCYRFLPEFTYYFVDYINGPDYTYFYGTYESYQNGSIYDIVPLGKIVRLNTDLTIDESFDAGTGFNFVFYDGNSLLEQPDGKIIATGNFTTFQGVSANRIIRLNTDGTKDVSFVFGTGFNGFTQGTAIDSLGRIIVLGLYSNYNGTPANRIIRLMPDGSVDGTFVYGTGFNNTTTDVLMNPDDSMYVVGYFNQYKGAASGNGIIKINSVGTKDVSFNPGAGFSPYLPNNPNDLVRIGNETSFYAAGYFTSYKGTPANRIVKIQSNGDIDPSFVYGTGFNASVDTIDVIWGDKLLVQGDSFTSYNGTTTWGSVILNADGSIYFAFPPPKWLHYPFVIGDKLYGAEIGECLELLYDNTPTTTTTSSTTSTTSTTTTITPTTTTTTTIVIVPGSDNCYIVQRCSDNAIFYVSKTAGCIFGSPATLATTWINGQYAQFVIGTSCPGGATYCGVVTGSITTIPTAKISSNTKPLNCFDGMCFE